VAPQARQHIVQHLRLDGKDDHICSLHGLGIIRCAVHAQGLLQRGAPLGDRLADNDLSGADDVTLKQPSDDRLTHGAASDQSNALALQWSTHPVAPSSVPTPSKSALPMRTIVAPS